MDLWDLLAPQGSEALWVSQDSEGRRAYWECPVLLAHLGKPERLESRAARGPPVESVHREPKGQEETPALGVSLEQTGLQGRTASSGPGAIGVMLVQRVWLVLQGLQETRVLWG